MTKVIVEESQTKQEVYNGQIRTNEGGRIVMVITDKRAEPAGVGSRTIRTLVLREGDNGFCGQFETVRALYDSDEKIIEKYPKVLSATITITEEE